MECGPDGVLGIVSNCGPPAEGPRCEMDFGCGWEQECCRERYGSSASESDIDAWVLTLRHNPPTPTPIPSEKKTGEEVIQLSSTGKDRKRVRRVYDRVLSLRHHHPFLPHPLRPGEKEKRKKKQ